MSSSVIHFIGPPLSFLNKPTLPQHYALCVVFVPAMRLDSCHLMCGKGHLTYSYGLGKTEGFTEGGGKYIFPGVVGKSSGCVRMTSD